MITCYFEDGDQALLRHAVVDALVIKDNKLLMVKRTMSLLEGGKWGLVGGYMERNETIEQTVVREVLEETGWEVGNLQLFRIIDTPNRPHEDRQNIAFVFICDAFEKVGTPDWESDDQQWFDWNKLPDLKQIAFDHADNINLYQKHIKKPFRLPIIGS